MLYDIDKLKEQARASGISLAAVCRRAGVGPYTTSRLKGGRGTVRNLTKLNLALAELMHERRGFLNKAAKEKVDG